MRMLVSSSDRAEMNHLNELMLRTGLKCHMREEPPTQEEASCAFYPELWIDEDDYNTGVVVLSHYRPKIPSSSPIGL